MERPDNDALKDAPVARPSGHRVSRWVLAVILVVVSVAVYGNALKGQFIWDDNYLVKDNQYTGDWSYVPELLKGRMTSKRVITDVRFYRPAQMVSYALDRILLWGNEPWGYHLTSVLIHAGAVLSVYMLLYSLYGDIPMSFFAAALFAVHPVHTEAVTYISGRSDPLSAFFILGSLYFYVKAVRRHGRFPIAVSVLCYGLALLSRETSFVLLALIPLYHYSFRQKIRWPLVIPFAAVTALYAAARTAAPFLSGAPASYGTLADRIPGVFAAITGYTRIMLFPVPLHMEYGKLTFGLYDWRVITGLLMTVSLAAYVLMRGKNNRGPVFFGICWTFIAFLPVSNLYPLNAYMAEHWMYLPSVGIFTVAGYALSRGYRYPGTKYTAVLAFLAIFSFCSVITFRQNMCWRDPMTFYEHTLRYAPDSSRTWDSLGSAYLAEGKNEEALEAYRKAVGLNGRFAKAYNNMGTALFNLGRFGESAAAYRKAVDIRPDFEEAYFNLGNTYAAMDRPDEAINAYNEAVALNGRFAKAYFNMSAVYYKQGRYEKAAEYCDKAARLGLPIPDTVQKLLRPYRDRPQR